MSKRVLKLVRDCQTTAGKLEKKAMMEKFINEYDTDDVFMMMNLLDPDINFNFSSKMVAKAKEFISNFHSTKSYTIREFLEQTASGKLSGNDALKAYANIMNTMHETDVELLDIILTRETLGFSLKSFNKVYKKLHKTDFISVFECQLADKYNPEKKYKNSDWYVTEKLDGLRAVFHAKKGKILTRNNKEVNGFEHIEKDLAKLCKEYNLDYCDGELFSKFIPFQQIQGIVMKDDHPDKGALKFNMFAVVGKDITSTQEMYEVMSIPESPIAIIEKFGVYISPLEPVIIENKTSEIMAMCNKYMDDGFEGAMLRSADEHYHYGRSKDLLKVKLFLEDDFVVTDVLEGTGRLIGKLGGLVLTNDKEIISISVSDNKKFAKGFINSSVGSGFSDAQREDLWKRRESLIGKLANIKYQGLTDAETSLRFPIFLGFKEDR